MNPTRATAVCLALLVIGSTVAEAGRTRSFRLEGATVFRKGEMNGATIDEEGRVGPGPAARLLESSAGAQVWSMIRDRRGALIVATGSDGALYRIVGKESKRIDGSFEYEIFAVVEGKDGRIFAAGAPNATISELLPDGTIKNFSILPRKWSGPWWPIPMGISTPARASGEPCIASNLTEGRRSSTRRRTRT